MDDRSRLPPARSVLVIDDEPMFVEIVSRALSPYGFEVDTACDGTTGLAMALSGRYGVVLLDLMLPGLDGVSILRRTMEARPEQRVLVCSALGDQEQQARCLELGAVGYLAKPFELSDLVARVRLQGSPPLAPATPPATTEGSVR